ncbi:MAG: hypothetical protein K8U57_40760 [Planctomycetes bacterium]|nr:hypothetical protein [Planctomycetota bacterium]
MFDDKLGPTEYRVKVDPVLEPPGDLAVYRVQVWTVGKQSVFLDAEGGQFTQEGDSKPETGGKLHRADFVLVVTLRPHSDPMLRGKKLELERRLRVGTVSDGGFTFLDNVDLTTKLEKVVIIPASTGTQKLGQKHTVGVLRGKKVEVSASKPDK